MRNPTRLVTTSTKARPSSVVWCTFSCWRMAPDSGARSCLAQLNSSWRYWRRTSGVFSMSRLANLASMAAGVSSAARMPLY